MLQLHGGLPPQSHHPPLPAIPAGARRFQPNNPLYMPNFTLAVPFAKQHASQIVCCDDKA